MRLTSDKGTFKIITPVYQLTTVLDRPYVYVEDTHGNRIMELFVLSGVHSSTGLDDTVCTDGWQAVELADSTILTLTAASSIWKRKTIQLHCLPERFVYDITVEGRRALTDVNYFGGYYSGQPRWGSGFFWSGHQFQQGFNPEPTDTENYYFHPSANSKLDLFGVPLPGKGSWFFTPPPFCLSFQGSNGWISTGVEASAGANRFTEFRYHGQQNSFYLSLSFEGHTHVNGSYTLPAIGFDFGEDPYDLLNQHVRNLPASKTNPTNKPAWWHEPIFCGWGAQCYLAELKHGKVSDFARQAHYVDFLRHLDAHSVNPGIIVLDDKWQAAYGLNVVDTSKWPDIKGFIHDQHLIGRKVLLWLKAWDAEGIPVEECITNAAGIPLAVDPTNPAFEQRFRESIRVMLAEYGADGFKIDFTARIPGGPGIRTYGDAWGLELMRLYLSILYDEAKAVKSDALIMTHTPHPYLADVVDMIRLNDINSKCNVNQAMQHRARVAMIACPNAIIDTDNWPMADKTMWRDYVRLQSELGVPSLYYASHIDATGEAFTEADYELIRQTWTVYRSKLRANYDR